MVINKAFMMEDLRNKVLLEVLAQVPVLAAPVVEVAVPRLQASAENPSAQTLVVQVAMGQQLLLLELHLD